MSEFAIAAGLVLLLLIVREWQWKRQLRREMQEEVRLGIVSDRDFLALSGFQRFSSRWIEDRGERRQFRKLSRRLVAAKSRQRRASTARRRLAQVEVLTLRTRLRQVRFGETPGSGQRGDDPEIGAEELY